jgi:3-oxoacyl-[acyl-carrier protein] reductase
VATTEGRLPVAQQQPTGRLDGQVALVTGGSRGIGRGIADELLTGGAAVVATYVRDENSAAEFDSAASAAGARAAALRCDVTDAVQCEAAVFQTLDRFGRLDIVVSNAGIASRGRTVTETTPEEVDRVLRVHALGAHYLSRAAIPALRRQASSSLIFISSVAAQFYAAGAAPYSMAKAALEALAHTIAREERGHGIRVNIVAPGLVDTEMGWRLVRAQYGLDDIRALASQSPFGRVCTVQEIGQVVRFLASSDASYVNDQRVVVDGGTF